MNLAINLFCVPTPNMSNKAVGELPVNVLTDEADQVITAEDGSWIVPDIGIPLE